MDEIKDLIKIVTDHTKRNVPLLDLKNQHHNGNKEMNLFLGIKNGEGVAFSVLTCPKLP